jgi:hypothetical protein
MTLEMLVSSALMEYTQVEQQRILIALEEGTTMPTARLKKGLEKVMEVFNTWEPIVEGYAGFPVDRETIDRKKREHDKDRNIGRVVRDFVITGKKADGRYVVVGKKGEKTAKAPEDMGLTAVKEGIDIEILHQQMLAEAKKSKKVKRWWDDDGDGKGYEKGEVKKEDAQYGYDSKGNSLNPKDKGKNVKKKVAKEDTDLINKLRDSGVFTEEELAKIAETDNE